MSGKLPKIVYVTDLITDPGKQALTADATPKDVIEKHYPCFESGERATAYVYKLVKAVTITKDTIYRVTDKK